MSRSTARRSAMTAAAIVALLAPAAAGTAAAAPHEYRIAPAHSEKCLDVLGGNTGDDADIVQWTCDGRTSQRFSATLASNDRWMFWSQGTEKCLTAVFAGEEGGDVVQRTCDGGPAQRWRVEGQADYGYRIVSAYTDLCLEVEHASWEDGAEVRQFRCHGQDNQRFSFDQVDA